MDRFQDKSIFNGIKIIIIEPLKFKLKLGINDSAYSKISISRTIYDIIDTFGFSIKGGLLTKGALVLLGITSPLSVVIVAGILSGGAWVYVSHNLKENGKGNIIFIPKFIKTDLDILALCFFEIMAPLALKMANSDNKIDIVERTTICNYFIKEWGYDPSFVNHGVLYIESKLHEYSIKDLAHNMAVLQKENPDCNYESMKNVIMDFLTSVVKADGIIDEREDFALEGIRKTFEEIGHTSFTEQIVKVRDNAAKTISDASNTILTKSEEAIHKTANMLNDICTSGSDAVKDISGKTARQFQNIYDKVKPS
jgi:hypothetical protein